MTNMTPPQRSGGTMHAHVESPFKFLMTTSHSAPDVSVQGLVDRFTTLDVKDRDEENSRRTVRRLESALKRAEMAREEAETEARSLRHELRDQRDMAEERLREKTDLRQRLDEYEKKYEKAKERFKQQKVKHEEQMRKMQKEYMEREKLHWRQQQQLQEEAEWERHLRTDANDLIAYLEIEHLVAMQFQKDRRLELQQSLRQQQAEHTSLQESAQHTPVEAPQQRDEPVDMDMDIAIDDSPEEPQANHAEPNAPRNSTTPARTSHTPIPTDSPQSTVAIAHTAPKPTLTQSQTLTVPINFNDDDDSSDKENNPQHQPRTPLPARHVSAPPHHLKTPMTVSSSTPALHPNIPHFLNTPIDREAALAAIRERRGRARSNGAATMTPRRLGRDASAPPIGGLSASVGRASARS